MNGPGELRSLVRDDEYAEAAVSVAQKSDGPLGDRLLDIVAEENPDTYREATQ